MNRGVDGTLSSEDAYDRYRLEDLSLANPRVKRLKSWCPTRPLVFVHIVRTAGTSLIAGLADAVDSAVYPTGFDRMLFGSFADFESIPTETRAFIHLDMMDMPTCRPTFAAGHMSLTSMRLAFPEAQFVSLLREPVARLLSHWLYWRVFSDTELRTWGDQWPKVVKLSRETLSDFLSAPKAAAQTDNLCLRTLLWPHPLIPDGDFIQPEHDDILIAAAMEKIAFLDYVDVIENPKLQDSLSAWLDRRLVMPRLNEVRKVPDNLKSDFSIEYASASDLVKQRSRLDFILWKTLANRLVVNFDAFHSAVVEATLAKVEKDLNNKNVAP